eukprot:3649239-Prymnesium_polylepis.1
MAAPRPARHAAPAARARACVHTTCVPIHAREGASGRRERCARARVRVTNLLQRRRCRVVGVVRERADLVEQEQLQPLELVDVLRQQRPHLNGAQRGAHALDVKVLVQPRLQLPQRRVVLEARVQQVEESGCGQAGAGRGLRLAVSRRG